MNKSVSFRAAGLSGCYRDSAGRVLPPRWGGCAFDRVLELALGAVWVSAGIVKARESADFVRDVLDYAVIGFDGAMIVGIVLPWLEIAIGACLVLGVASRIAVLLSGALLGAFVALQVSAIARGLTIDCGCGLVTGDESAVVGWGTVLRTALLLAVTVILGAWHIRRDARGSGWRRNGRPNPAVPRQNPQIALLAVAGFILWGGSTWAQSDRPNDGAYWYTKASDRLSEFTIDEFNALSEYLHAGPGAERPQWVEDLLDRFSPLLEDVKHGARRKHATLNMGYAIRGTPSNTQMPFRMEMAAFSMLLWADAVHSGDTTSAAESVAAMYTLAAHQVMDSPDASRSAMGRFMNAEAAADRLLDEGRLAAR